jgi:hypothetical protein
MSQNAEMEDDSDHHQSFLVYNGKEIKVKESVPKILLAFKNLGCHYNSTQRQGFAFGRAFGKRSARN